MYSSNRPGRVRQSFRLTVHCSFASPPGRPPRSAVTYKSARITARRSSISPGSGPRISGQWRVNSRHPAFSATAGAGSISAFAVASAQRLSNIEVGDITVVATASLSDTFTEQTQSALPVVLEFAVGAAGSVSTLHDGSIAGAIAQAGVTWSISVVGNGQNVTTSGGVSENWVRRPPNYNPRITETIEIGLSFTDFTIAVSVPGGVGSMFTVNMATSMAAHAVGGNAGLQYSALADFGNSLHWFGLLVARFEHGTPDAGAVLLTSESGFDYAQAVTTVPLPGVPGVFIAGTSLLAAQARRNRRPACVSRLARIRDPAPQHVRGNA